MGEETGREGRPSLNRARLRRGFVLAASLSAATLIVICLATLERETFSALSNLSPLYLLLAAALSLGRWSWAVARMRLVIASTGKKVPIRDVIKTVYAGYFTGLITPWRAGGVTGEMVFLHIYGLQAGEAVAVISFGACVSTVLLMLFFPFAIWIASRHIDLSFSLQGFLFSALAIGLLYLTLVLWALLRPQAAVDNALLNHSPAFLRRRGWYRRFLQRLSSEVRTFAHSLRRILYLGKAKLAAVLALTALYWFTGFMAMPVALVGLGYGSYFWKAVAAQLVIQILIPFIPTPGASGVGEVGFLFVYRSILPDAGVAGLLTLVWRFIDFYLGLLVGGAAFMLIMRDLGRAPRPGTGEARRGKGAPETGTGSAPPTCWYNRV